MAMRPCARPGCTALVARGYCSAHDKYTAKAIVETTRPSAHKRGYTRRWAEYSRNRLREYPLCADPRNVHGLRYVAATLTDHIVPHKGNRDLFWDPGNHQSLCKACHDTKTATEDGGFGHYKQIHAQ